MMTLLNKMPNFYSIKLMTRGGGKKKPKWRRRNMWMAKANLSQNVTGG